MKSEVHSHSRCQISSGATLPLRDFLKQGLVVAVLSTLLHTTTPLMCSSSPGTRVPQNGRDGAGRGDSRSFILETISRLLSRLVPNGQPVVNLKMRNEYIIQQLNNDRRRAIFYHQSSLFPRYPVTCLTLSAARLLRFLMYGWRTSVASSEREPEHCKERRSRYDFP